MTRTRLILGAATATATAAVLLLGGIFHDSSAATPSPDRPGGVARSAPGGLLAGRQQHGSLRERAAGEAAGNPNE